MLSPPPIAVSRERVVSIHRQNAHATCILANGTNLLVSPLLASYIRTGDEITFPIPTGGATGADRASNGAE